MVDWDQLVQERNAWVAHNFPTPTEGREGMGSVYGVIEELGELVHAHLKEDQGIRGTAEEHQAAAKDAVGDLTVYLLGIMEFYGVRPVGERDSDKKQAPLCHLAQAVGNLAGDFATAYSEWATVTIDSIVDCLRCHCEARGWDYDEVVQQTWDHVKQRDWIAYPDTGLPPVEESIT